jgi:hypothetical protein
VGISTAWLDGGEINVLCAVYILGPEFALRITYVDTGDRRRFLRWARQIGRPLSTSYLAKIA